MKMREGSYHDNSMHGEAPTGTPMRGQSAGAEWPGVPNMTRGNMPDNPSDRDMRMNMLYDTIERNDIKSEAGERMMHKLHLR